MSIEFEYIDDKAPGLYEGPTLHKLDSKGKHRTWKMQLTGDGHYRTLSGLATGKQAESGWTVPVPKSKDTVKDQGEFEVRAQYDHQLAREYYLDAADINTPKMIEPMLAKTYKTFQEGYAQPKLDGMRCIMTAEGMFTRQGQPIVAVPHLIEGAKPLFAAFPDAILDGELYNHRFRDDFNSLMSICRKQNPTAAQIEEAKVVQYHVYDLVEPQHTFPSRAARVVERLMTVDPALFVVVETVPVKTATEFDDAYARFIGDGYEGGMLRPRGDPGYQLGSRSKFLLKRKDFITEEFKVKSVEAGTGNWAGAAKKFVLDNGDGREFGAGTRGSYKAMKALLDSGKLPAEVTLRFFERTPDGIPRFPVVIDIHMDGRTD